MYYKTILICIFPAWAQQMLPLQEIYAPAGSTIRGELKCLLAVYKKI